MDEVPGMALIISKSEKGSSGAGRDFRNTLIRLAGMWGSRNSAKSTISPRSMRRLTSAMTLVLDEMRNRPSVLRHSGRTGQRRRFTLSCIPYQALADSR